MQKIKIAIVPGDGICQEIFPYVDELIDKLNLEIQREYFEVGLNRLLKTGRAIDDETIEKIKQCNAVLFGANSTPKESLPGYRSPILSLRQELGLFVNLRPVKNYLSSRNINITIFRENTEGLYCQKERFIDENTVVAEKIVSRATTEKLARFAYKYAANHGMKRMTIVQKSNVLKLSDRFFLDICKQIGGEYPEIETSAEYIDAACYHLVRTPERFEGILTENLYGDVLSDLAAGISDGLGMAPSSSFGEKHALFEPVHGSAPDIVGRDIANPYAVVFSLILMLDYLQFHNASNKLRKAVYENLNENIVTPDLNGSYKLSETMGLLIKKV